MNAALYYGIYLLGVLVSSVSQVLLKKAALKHHGSRVKEYLNPWVITAYVLFFAATFATIYAYKVIPISAGPILEATSYLYITVFGVFLFKEHVGKAKAFAMTLIVAGTVVYAYGLGM